MQPLSTHERLRAHTITKGIMDPFASLLTGILLIVILKFDPGKHLESLNYVLLALGIAWIIGIYRIHQQYLKTLLKTIGNRFFNNTEFSINDSSTLHWIKNKLSSGNETEALNILKMCASHPALFNDDIVLAALENPSVNIKTQAVQLAEQKKMAAVEDQLRSILESSDDPGLVAECIKALSAIHMREQEILPFITNANAAVQKAAITGILMHGNDESKQEAKT